MSQLLTVEDVAQRLNTSNARIYDIVRSGHLSAVRIGRQLRFTDEAVDSYIAQGGHTLPGGWRREPADGAAA